MPHGDIALTLANIMQQRGLQKDLIVWMFSLQFDEDSHHVPPGRLVLAQEQADLLRGQVVGENYFTRDAPSRKEGREHSRFGA